MKYKWKQLLASILCGVMILSQLPPVVARADAGEEKRAAYGRLATTSNAEEGEAGTDSGYRRSTSSDAVPEVPEHLAVRAPASNGLGRVSSLGDLWDGWSGKTSFEFLSGRQGDGTSKRPFLIKNREQLMGLSQLTAMGMTVPAGESADYVGDYSDCYFALGGNIDMQGVEWIPIGFYRDCAEAAGEITNPFQGDFNGNNYEIRNLKMNKLAAYNHIGLFGSVQNSSIHDITVIPGTEIRGNDRVGVVVGYAVHSVIKNATVKNAALRTSGVSGGIAGEINGTVLENAVCDNVIIDARAGAELIYAGGIVGIASDSSVIDCQVSTGKGSASRIQGTGYIGGIAGYQNAADIYNVQVTGAIGGYGSTAIGGITGRYASGKLKVARFEGIIGNSQLGSMAREGTFIGTRQGAATNFDYVEDVAYLFADSESKVTANVCGSGILDDNDYTYEAHIGYWHPADLYFTLLQGGSGKNVTDRFFYEELETGILAVMDEVDDARYTMDHIAPNSVGRPVRGYLIRVNQVDTVANGQNFYDIALLEAKGTSAYSKTLHKDCRGAVAAGSVVYVNTVPNNTATEKFQLDKTPFYTDASGVKTQAPYLETSHCYAFRMPQEDIAVAAVYKKVAASIAILPNEYRFTVTQTRTGNRKSPVKTTEIKNNEGKLIARYMNGTLEQGTQIQPVAVNAVIDANNDVNDDRVKWSVDDADLIGLDRNDDEGTDGYTAKSASIAVNLNAGFFTEIIIEQEKKQAEENYQYKIPNTIYGAGHQNGGIAVLTAQTRPAASFEGKPCMANCRIQVTFQILDHTLIAAEGASLDKSALAYTVCRILTGSRKAPREQITVTAPQAVTAAFTPDFFSRDQVAWTSSDPAVVQVSQDAQAYREASVFALKDAKWIRDIMAQDAGISANDEHDRISGSGERKVTVTVEGKDKLGNRALASCHVTVRFVTKDETIIEPEAVSLNETRLEYHLSYDKAGDIHSETVEKHGFESRMLKAVVLPDIEDTENHRPYDRKVTWSSSDPAALTVDQNGTLTVQDGSPWIHEAMAKAPYSGEKTIAITAETIDGRQKAVCSVTLMFQANCVEADRETETFEIVLTKTGRRSNPVLAYTGQESKKLNAVIYSEGNDFNHVVWTSSDPSALTVSSDGTMKPVLLDDKQELKAQWIKDLLASYPYGGTNQIKVTAATAQGRLRDQVSVLLDFKMVDKTYSSGSSGGGTGGAGTGGSGGGSIGVTTVGKTTGALTAPMGSLTGTWTQAANGKWVFAADRTYADEWAYISNPYASKGQPGAAWFRFDSSGFMITGWHSDDDGAIYYLNPISDGTQGQMAVDWRFIDGAWYYFQPVSDGKKGRMIKDAMVQGIYRVNGNGQWVNGNGQLLP